MEYCTPSPHTHTLTHSLAAAKFKLLRRLFDEENRGWRQCNNTTTITIDRSSYMFSLASVSGGGLLEKQHVTARFNEEPATGPG